MDLLAPGQTWIYRPPAGFDSSRIVIGAVVPLADNSNLVCCSVLDAPRDGGQTPGDTVNILFLPMTESAFRASVVGQDGARLLPTEFQGMFDQWLSETGGQAAFSVPFTGRLDTMVDLEFAQRERLKTGSSTERLLAEVGKLLASGLETRTEPFPKNQQEFDGILGELRQLKSNDVYNRLIIAGFLDHPHGPDQNRCMECIYFLPHKTWCDLPEIDLPVESYWWCRLWKV